VTATIPAKAPPRNTSRPSGPRELAQAAAGPVICAVVSTGLLSGWVLTGGAGTLTRVKLQVSLAPVPMRAFTPRTAAAADAATTFLTIRNLSGTDELIGVRSPLARHADLTKRNGPAAQGTRPAASPSPRTPPSP
jgi:hypothetical protein